MAESPDKLYHLLGVSREASDAEIKKNYRRLAKEFHPDKNPLAGDRFKEISYAYEVLSDPKMRQSYDRFGLKGLQEGGHSHEASPFGFSHFFSGVMDGLGGSGFRRRNKSNDTVLNLSVSLADLYNGKTASLDFTRNIVCPTCHGIGSASGNDFACKVCRGRGIRLVTKQLIPGFAQQIQLPCYECRGEGRVIDEADQCQRCFGQQVVAESETLEVHVDKGMHDSQTVSFRGRGNQQPDSEPSDVTVVLAQKKHKQFQRDGHDLIMLHDLTVTEALCGFRIVIRHLDGRELLVEHPPGHVIKPGDIRAVPNEGMPMYRNPFEKGNLYIKFSVIFPDNHFQGEEMLRLLETCLPQRPPFVMPVGEHVEEVDLSEYSPQENKAKSEEGYGREDEGISCAYQ